MSVFIALALSLQGLLLVSLANRVLDLVFDNGTLSFLTVLPLLVLLASAVWMIRTSTDRGVLALYLSFVLIFGGLLFFPARFFVGMLRFEWAVASALNGQIDPSDTNRFEWECRWDCPDQDWMQAVPKVRDVRCVQRLRSSGACCQAYFPNGVYSEVHVFRTGFHRYRMQFYSYPMCRNPDFDPAADPDSPEGNGWMRCDELWRSRPPSNRPSFTDSSSPFG